MTLRRSVLALAAVSLALVAACGPKGSSTTNIACRYEKRSTGCNNSTWSAWESGCTDFSDDAYDDPRAACRSTYPATDSECVSTCCVRFEFRSVSPSSGRCPSGSGGGGGSGSGGGGGTSSGCTSERTCGGCTAWDGCGWCASTASCREGSSTGPSSGTCSGWRWLSNECSGGAGGGGGSSSTCSAPTTSSSCSSASLSCGAYCCPSTHPYFCRLTQNCYLSASAAAATCGTTACTRCSP